MDVNAPPCGAKDHSKGWLEGSPHPRVGYTWAHLAQGLLPFFAHVGCRITWWKEWKWKPNIKVWFKNQRCDSKLGPAAPRGEHGEDPLTQKTVQVTEKLLRARAVWHGSNGWVRRLHWKGIKIIFGHHQLQRGTWILMNQNYYAQNKAKYHQIAV